MRLRSIKLSGFKSFAEPVHFQLPGQLVGVVGPNGCGKSNIMDAVRWVLGESRASELRGESMQDVIFNGSTTRKPASRASVELAFDNSEHRAGGQWSQFAEVAVKRVLTRDGASSYHINNQVVRKRDIHDVFMGTGLGPRAYAIIGQGTISRIIESRPEELRLFLEEAAGVSRYKERRRESENRLHDTRENLTRVHDILCELNAQLEKLEQQAVVAQRYRDLQQEASRKQHYQWWIRRADASTELVKVQAQGQAAVLELESQYADLRASESALETLRSDHYAVGDRMGQTQGRVYDASAKVGQLEAELRYRGESQRRAQERLQQLAQQKSQWLSSVTQAEIEMAQLQEQREDMLQTLAVANAQKAQVEDDFAALENEVQRAQKLAQQQSLVVQQMQQQLQVLATEERHADERMRELQQQLERLRSVQDSAPNPDEDQLQSKQRSLSAAQEDARMQQAQLAELEEDVAALEQQRLEEQQTLSEAQNRHSELQARLHALQAVQAQVQAEGSLGPWLAKQGLDHLPPLWQRLQVDSGWETAVEAALRERLHALEVGRLDSMAVLAKDAPHGTLVFFNAADAHAWDTPSGRSELGLPTLSDKVQCQAADAGLSKLLRNWLGACYVAQDLTQALAHRAQLQAQERIMVPDGHAIGPASLHFYSEDSAQAGMLARAQEIENLERNVRAQTLLLGDARAVFGRSETRFGQLRAQVHSQRQQAQQMLQHVHGLEVAVLRLQQAAEHARSAVARLMQDKEDVQAQLQHWQQRKDETVARFEDLDRRLAEQQELYAHKQTIALDAERALQQAREQHRALERQLQEQQFQARTLESRVAEITRTIASVAQQQTQLDREEERVSLELAQTQSSDGDEALQQALAVKVELEQSLRELRQQYEYVGQQLRTGEERRMRFEREVEPLRKRISDLQLREQALQMQRDQMTEQLQQAQVDELPLAQEIEQQGVRLAGLQEAIERAQQAMQTLGAVNLAALEELGQARERKQFLDQQSQDLQEAITTLENAIRKIDAQTRELLGETFAVVNRHFGAMFPKLFGGGQAKLVMTGAEILDAGVQVLAQPPGKKNQTIYLLSGGEKALTAIALVFAIFQLNPAPFCLLDEVDAPLDDANTSRYCQLVKNMSCKTQFLFISHNKIAMEMAEQLVGVTMQEQGVSRIVAVDMTASAPAS